MALPSSGEIKFSQFQSVFGGTNPINLSEYYRGGSLVPNTPQNIGIPLSGAFSLSDAYGGDALSFSMTPATQTLDEGGVNDGADPSTQSFTVTTTGFSSGTTGTLYWKLNTAANGSGTDATTADFNAVSGTITSTNNTGSFSVTVKDDNTTEGDETWYVLLSTTAGGTPVTTSTITVKDTSIAATYTATAPATINEGVTGTINITSGGVADGTTVYWTITTDSAGTTNATTADFTAVTGSTTINSNAGSFSIAPIADTLTEGDETYYVQIKTGSVTGSIVATTSSFVIKDTSLSAPTYTFDAGNAATVDEGTSTTITINTANVVDGTTLYYSLEGTGVAAGDFTAGSLTGSFTVNSNSGTFNVDPLIDATNEGDETVSMKVRTGSVSGTVVATDSITIKDKTPTYTLVSPTSVNEGSVATITVNTTNVADGTTLYWSITPGPDDFTDQIGTVVINSNSGTFTSTVNADSLTEGAETATVRVRVGSQIGTIIATDTFTVNDTSISAVITATINTDGDSSVSEGSSINMNIFNTSSVSHTFTWEVVDPGNDFNAPITGTTTVAAGDDNAVSSGQSKQDLTTEGAETITVRVKDDQGNILDSATITLNDTSTTPAPSTGMTGGGTWLAFVFSSGDIPTTTSRNITFSGTPNTTYNLTYSMSSTTGPTPTFYPSSVTLDGSGSKTISVDCQFNSYAQTEGTVTITMANGGDTASTGPHNYELAI